MNRYKSDIKMWLNGLILLTILAIGKCSEADLTVEAAFQGRCGHNSPCEQLCYELHDGMYECDCTEGYDLNKNGYSCQEINSTLQPGMEGVLRTEEDVLYQKGASFSAKLDSDMKANSLGLDDDDEGDDEDVAGEDNNSSNSYGGSSRGRSSFSNEDENRSVAGGGETEDDSEDEESPVANRNRINNSNNGSNRNSNNGNDDNDRKNYNNNNNSNDQDREEGDSAAESLPSSSEDSDEVFTYPKNVPETHHAETNSNNKYRLRNESQSNANEANNLGMNTPTTTDGVILAAVAADGVDDDSGARPESGTQSKSETGSESRSSSSSSAGQSQAPSGAAAVAGGTRIGSNDDNYYPKQDMSVYDDVNNNRLNLRNFDDVPTYQSSSDKSVENNDRTGTGAVEITTTTLSTTILPNVTDTTKGSSMEPCLLDCGSEGICDYADGGGKNTRCLCPFGKMGHACGEDIKINIPRFTKKSWLAFPALRGAYKHVQLRVEFRPETFDGIILLTGERDDLTGDFMALLIHQGFIEFWFDCGSGTGSVRSKETVLLNQWNSVTIYRHRWDAWLVLNHGTRVQGRSKGLFSRITFREPVFLGGIGNITGLAKRLPVYDGMVGCIRRFIANEHEYKFTSNPFGDVTKGFDIQDCTTDKCVRYPCQHGGKCLPSDQGAVCLCPLGFGGDLCEMRLDLQVPSFNGSSYLRYAPLGDSALIWLELQIIIKPYQEDGILLYSGHEEYGDYIALSLNMGFVEFAFDLGSGPALVRSEFPLAMEQWHTVKISRTARLAVLKIDQLSEVMTISSNGFWHLSLPHSLFLGGIHNVQSLPLGLKERGSFVGCIQKVEINGRSLNIISEALGGTNVDNCPHACVARPCGALAECIPLLDNYECRCSPFTAQCNKAEELPLKQIMRQEDTRIHQQTTIPSDNKTHSRNTHYRIEQPLSSSQSLSSSHSSHLYRMKHPTKSQVSTNGNKFAKDINTDPEIGYDYQYTGDYKTRQTGDSNLKSKQINGITRKHKKFDFEKTSSKEKSSINDSGSRSRSKPSHSRTSSHHGSSLTSAGGDAVFDGSGLANSQSFGDSQFGVDRYMSVGTQQLLKHHEKNKGLLAREKVSHQKIMGHPSGRITEGGVGGDGGDIVDERTSTGLATEMASSESTGDESVKGMRRTPHGPELVEDSVSVSTGSGRTKAQKRKTVHHRKHKNNDRPAMGLTSGMEEQHNSHRDDGFAEGGSSSSSSHVSHNRGDGGSLTSSTPTNTRSSGSNLFMGENDFQTRELIEDMERIMKNSKDLRSQESSTSSAFKRTHGACFTGTDSYFHYNDAETMSQIISYRIDLNLRFKTHSNYGVILWSGRQSALDSDDFLSLGIENGYLHLRYNLGSGEINIQFNSTRVSDGLWHRVRAIRNLQEGSLEVDGRKSVVQRSPGKLRQLNTDTGLYVGGMPDVIYYTRRRYFTGIVGCISEIVLAGELKLSLDPATLGTAHNVEVGIL